MSFRIVPSKRFRKAVQKYKSRRQIVAAAEEAVHLLSIHDRESLVALGTRWRDHPLKGDKIGIRELHLSLDDLLLYRVNEKDTTIELLDIVSHEELRKM